MPVEVLRSRSSSIGSECVDSASGGGDSIDAIDGRLSTDPHRSSAKSALSKSALYASAPLPSVGSSSALATSSGAGPSEGGASATAAERMKPADMKRTALQKLRSELEGRRRRNEEMPEGASTQGGEHTARAAQTARAWAPHRPELNTADLKGKERRGEDLWRADLRGANLLGARLPRANLMHAELSGANLICANLRGAQLQSVGLHGANLQGAGLQDANMRSTNLTGAVLIGANLDGANLVGAILSHASLVGASLLGADLRGADLRWADLRHVSPPLTLENMFDQLNMVGARTEGIKLDSPVPEWMAEILADESSGGAAQSSEQLGWYRLPQIVHSNSHGYATYANNAPVGGSGRIEEILQAGTAKRRGWFGRLRRRPRPTRVEWPSVPKSHSEVEAPGTPRTEKSIGSVTNKVSAYPQGSSYNSK